jgi:hypothetical protein
MVRPCADESFVSVVESNVVRFGKALATAEPSWGYRGRRGAYRWNVCSLVDALLRCNIHWWKWTHQKLLI